MEDTERFGYAEYKAYAQGPKSNIEWASAATVLDPIQKIVNSGTQSVLDSEIHTDKPEVAYPYPIKPAGYKMLVKMYETPKQVGSIVIPESRKADEDVASMMAEVLAMGEQVYDPTREQFSHGPWCKVGDIIIIASYTGVRIKVAEVEYRLISDDSVVAVVVDVDKVGTLQRGY